MPGFREHITGSTIVGIGYGTAAWYVGEIPPLTCLLGAGLCSVAGMLPDLDSGPGIPLKESVAFAAAVVAPVAGDESGWAPWDFAQALQLLKKSADFPT